MDFRTQITIKTQEHNQIDYASKIVLFGSCFSKNISQKLAHFRFQHFANPFGILFHPNAIEANITNAINKKIYTENDLFFYNERWHCFEAHSSLSDTSKESLLNHLNTAITTTHQQLENASHILITLGTAWVYRFVESDTIVANCHKIPQKQFLKELRSVEEIKENLQAIIEMIRSINKKTSIIFTVSPVRHLKDGFIENTQSKSHLISAVHQVVEPRKRSHYFPSYEIVLDDLRDYRFYKEDMIHPNQTAIDYIWQQFSTIWISESAQRTMQEVTVIQKGLSHRPFNKNSEQYRTFLINLEKKMETLQKEFPFIDFSQTN